MEEKLLNPRLWLKSKDLKWFPDDMGQETPIPADVIFNNGGSRNVWSGRVARVKAMMDQRTRTLPMVVEVDEITSSANSIDQFSLRPGMFVTVQIKGKRVENVFVLPRYLVYPGNVVYTVKEHTLKSNSVTILRGYKDKVIIGDGLTSGDLIVKSPLSAPTDGQAVRLKPDGS